MPAIIAALAHNLTLSLWIEGLHIGLSALILWFFRKFVVALQTSESKISRNIDRRILRATEVPMGEIKAAIKEHADDDVQKFAVATEERKRIEGKVDGIELKVNELLRRPA